jgi:hypothetical protein
VHLLSLQVTDIQVRDATNAIVLTDEEWTDRITDSAGRLIRAKDPWKISETYELVALSGRWLVNNADIRER